MNTRVFLITAKTNLHVGNENGGDFTIIDKAIQRDALTDLPCINSSSLKGAINEYCTNGQAKMDGELRARLFGSDKADKKKDAKKGEAIFFDAKLLYLPQQDDSSLYHYATSQAVFDEMNSRIHAFGLTQDEKIPATWQGKNVDTLDTEKFNAICNNDNLPIIARNCLENGQSVNLWYEQVLPAETVMYAIICEEGDDLLRALDGQLIQIGANATIGYGYCQFKALNIQ